MPKPTNSYTGGSSAQKRRAPGQRRPTRSGNHPAKLLLAALLGSMLTVAGIVAYFYLAHPPVAVADKPALWEHLTETVPLRHRVSAEAKQPPFPAGEDGFESAARGYRAQCAQCHGTPGHESAVGREMIPRAQQFFGRDRRSTAAKPAGELFWPTAFGVRRSGMPAYSHALSNTELWNLALLLHSADQPLPEPVRKLLLEASSPAAAPPSAASTPPLPATHRLGPENDFR